MGIAKILAEDNKNLRKENERLTARVAELAALNILSNNHNEYSYEVMELKQERDTLLIMLQSLLIMIHKDRLVIERLYGIGTTMDQYRNVTDSAMAILADLRKKAEEILQERDILREALIHIRAFPTASKVHVLAHDVLPPTEEKK